VRPDETRPQALQWSHVYDFQDLMARRVENIILVSSTYDTFILQEDGLLSELMLGEFLDLNLHHTTGITHVSSGAEAIQLASSASRFNLIVAAVQLGDMDAAELAEKVRRAGLDVPVVLLAFDGGELADFMARNDTSALERVFMWQGDPRVLLAIAKYMEDRLNLDYDVGVAGCQLVLLVEDNIRYYSSFLPVIYTEIISHSQRLLAEKDSLVRKILAMRARPKILLCTSFEEAWGYFSTFQENVLGVISDVEFPRGGELDSHAGADLATLVKRAWFDIPVLLQSSRQESAQIAREVGADFLLKGSPTMLQDLRQFMVDNFFFGDFVFRMPDGAVVGRADDLKTLLEMLRVVPAESIVYHADRNHFSRWLKARAEFHLAHHLRLHTSAESPEARRRYLVQEIEAYRREKRRESVSDFDPDAFDPNNSFARVGNGSLGGKARALAFMRHLLRDFGVSEEFPGVHVTVPPSLVLTTEVFDRFLGDNDLREFALESEEDEEIERRFLSSPLPEDVMESLGAYLRLADYPLAVRSSSLLEDSQYQPLAGVYETYLIPNNAPEPAVRLERLAQAVKRVYASTFHAYAKNSFKVTPYRLEEEKMAVIIQKVVGGHHGPRFYPDFAGVGRSYNYYPSPPLAPEEGVVVVALGLGRTVVEGGNALAFSPRHPQHPMSFSTVKEMLANSQRDFIAIDTESSADQVSERHYPLAAAETDGTLGPMASTYTAEDDAVHDGLSRQGPRLVSFGPLLKQHSFPLPEVLERLLSLGRWGMNTEVELEFAVRLPLSPESPAEFGFVQMRPMARSRDVEDLDTERVDPADVLVRSDRVLGNGKMVHIKDIVMVDPTAFDRAKSRETAAEVARLNARLVADGSPYLLVGLGRWGSADPWLGIPVTWQQISGARVIVESGLREVSITPSQGSHFFQNLTSFRVGYFTVNPENGNSFVDWDWLARQPALDEGEFVRHLRLPAPLLVIINGKQQTGVILKPAAS
jgi:CheY-like chemotaxis protein